MTLSTPIPLDIPSTCYSDNCPGLFKTACLRNHHDQHHGFWIGTTGKFLPRKFGSFQLAR